jgi:hypothetical protein
MEVAKQLTCPNCGANITNTRNCEYCGSLLVRFIDNNIALDEKKYGSSAFRLAGLKEALVKNLAEQDKADGQNHIHTCIRCKELELEFEVTNPRSQAEVVQFQWAAQDYVWNLRTVPSIEFNTNERSLVVCVRFYEINSNQYLYLNLHNDFNNFYSEQHSKFKKLDIYKLFTYTTSPLLISPGGGLEMKSGVAHQYYIDFGRDIDGAAAIITQYLLNCSTMQSLRSYNLEYDLISMTEDEYQAYLLARKNDSRNAKIMGILFGLAGIIGGVLIMMYKDGFYGVVGGPLCILGGLFFVVICLKGES